MSAPLRQRDRGFTLVELMVVVAILAILVAIAVASYFVATGRSRRIACLNNQRTLQAAVTVYRADHAGEAPADGHLELLQPYVNWPSANYGRCIVDDQPLILQGGYVSCPNDHDP